MNTSMGMEWRTRKIFDDHIDQFFKGVELATPFILKVKDKCYNIHIRPVRKINKIARWCYEWVCIDDILYKVSK